MHATPDVRNLLAEAADLLEGELCIWCERQPKAATSHLCSTCRQTDSGGLLHRVPQLQVATPAG